MCSVQMRQSVQDMTNHFGQYFKLEEDDTMPSSFWDEHMVMLTDEDLPIGMRVYSSWNEYSDRTHGKWYWHAPIRVFRLPSEEQFLLAQNNGEMIVYDKSDKKIKHLKNHGLVHSYESILSLVNVNE